MPVEGYFMSDQTQGMSNSILVSIKKQLNIGQDYHAFDSDVILLINSAFATLHQLGVGPEEGFAISGDKEVWNDFMSFDSYMQFNNVKRFVYMEVRMTFDPPTASILTAFKEQLDELKWRITVAVDDASM